MDLCLSSKMLCVTFRLQAPSCLPATEAQPHLPGRERERSAGLCLCQVLSSQVSSPEQKVMQKRHSVKKPEVLYAAASCFLEMSRGIKDSALNSTCRRHVLHYVLRARTH